ncbi:MAG TPA: tetratricopeptide repeat protein [Humisphaera sp.]
MARKPDHDSLIRRGLALHEARRYSAALPYFDRALTVAPACPVAAYNRANALHMLDRDREAEPILRGLLAVAPSELHRRCPTSDPRSLQMDACCLLFWVLLHGRGFSAEAFRFADEHLRRRRRGLRSAWSAREVREDVAAMRTEWNHSPRS